MRQVGTKDFTSEQRRQIHEIVHTYQYMEDIHQIELLIRNQWTLFENTDDPSVRKECLNAIHNYTITRHKLYDFLPSLCTMRPFEDAETVARSDSNFTSRLY